MYGMPLQSFAKNKNKIKKLQLVVCRGSYALGISSDV